MDKKQRTWREKVTIRKRYAVESGDLILESVIKRGRFWKLGSWESRDMFETTICHMEIKPEEHDQIKVKEELPGGTTWVTVLIIIVYRLYLQEVKVP
ncbi:hypothetical protein SESBI_30721 [Sesbania bispinosa]|nr:hypothetical protein SESBI_30721 [Sesbania bispinosa]